MKKEEDNKEEDTTNKEDSQKENKTNKEDNKEEVCEVFEIDKDGKKETVKSCGLEEVKEGKKGQVENQNKILRNVLIFLGIFMFASILIFISINSSKNFEYKGIHWNRIKEGEVIFYHTSFPAILEGRDVNYNVYLRNDPRTLDKIPFKGDLNLYEMMVINSTNDFVCGGNGGIAMINLQQIVSAFGIKTMKDPQAGCDPEDRYMFVTIQEGETTGIEQISQSCYNFNVNNCEILKVTEKFIVETLVKLL